MSAKFMHVAQAVALLSKDTTKVGALILGPHGEGGPWGYNGAPRGCHADEDDRRERPEKYWWMEHAERNAIYAAARAGFTTKGTTMVVTHPPCMDCARAIVQAGITRVVAAGGDDLDVTRWGDHLRRAQALFKECGVQFEIVVMKEGAKCLY